MSFVSLDVESKLAEGMPVGGQSLDHPLMNTSSDMADDETVKLSLTVQNFVKQNKLEEAENYLQDRLSHYPNNERVLALASLVAMTSQKWGLAVERLVLLLDIQGESAPAAAHLMLIRSLRCDGKHLEAMRAAQSAVRYHANHQEIVEEAAAVSEYLFEWESAVLALEVLVEMQHMKEMDEEQDSSAMAELIKRLDTAKLMSLAIGSTNKIEL